MVQLAILLSLLLALSPLNAYPSEIDTILANQGEIRRYLEDFRVSDLEALGITPEELEARTKLADRMKQVLDDTDLKNRLSQGHYEQLLQDLAENLSLAIFEPFVQKQVVFVPFWKVSIRLS